MTESREEAPSGPQAAERHGRRSGSHGLGAWLELLRVFLTPSALADSHAGLLLAALWTDMSPGSRSIASAALTSALVYWFGMVVNDLFDLRRDRQRAPHRPLPSGRVSVTGAVVLAVALGVSSLALAARLEILGIVATILAFALLYDAGAKNIPVVGNLLLGGCRAGNFLVGPAVLVGSDVALGEPRAVLAAAVLGLYISGVTAISRLEEYDPNPRVLRLRAFQVFLVPCILVGTRTVEPLAWINGGILAGILLGALFGATRGASGRHPAAVFVSRALGGVYFVDLGLVIALGPPDGDWTRAAVSLYTLAALGWLWRWTRVRAGGEGS